MGGVVGDVVNAVGNVAEAAVSTVGASTKVVTNTIAGGSTKDALHELGASVNKGYTASVDISTLGQGEKLDAVTGGLYTASQGAGKMGGDLLQGKSVRTDLKDTVRTAAVAGATIYGGPSAGIAVNAGLSRGGKTNLSLKSVLATGASAAGMKGLASAIDPNPQPKRPSNNQGTTQSGYFSDIPSEIFQGADKNLVIPLVIGIVLVVIIVIVKKKK